MLSERFEYILKGVFLGLMLFVALNAPGWDATGRIALYMLAGLGIALILGVIRQYRDLGRLASNPGGFFLFLLLENPFLIYAGLVFGLAFGAIVEQNPFPDELAGCSLVAGTTTAAALWNTEMPAALLWYCVVGGGLLGYGFAEMRRIKDRWYRLTVPVAAMIVVGYLLIEYWLPDLPLAMIDRQLLAVHILLGLPFFYLLTFTGVAEESEVEIAAICGGLGFAIYLLGFPKNLPAAGFLIPVTLYFVYAVYVLPGLRVFKHTLRGYSYMQLRKTYPALVEFRRALQLDRKNQLAQRGLWHLHAGLNVDTVARDPRILEMLDPAQMLERIKLLLSNPPTQGQMDEAGKLLELVERQWPQRRPQTEYAWAVAALHSRLPDKAAEIMERLLDPTAWSPDDKSRRDVLFDAWQLVLFGHPKLRQRVGEPQLELPGRRVEAIAAAERRLSKAPDDPGAQELRKHLYATLREDEYIAAAADGPVKDFGYAYAEGLGMSQIDDPEHWQRGAFYLRVAGHGLPEKGPAIFDKLAVAYEQRGDHEAARRYRQKLRDTVLAVGGPATLPVEQKQIYFTTVKRLADDALERQDWDEAIANLGLYTQFEGSGIETLRNLAEAYEKKHDIRNALRVTEKGLVYDKRDVDMLARKDKYYYSLEPDELKKSADEMRGYFDTRYCVRKAKELLDRRESNLDLIDWALHLAKLAMVMEPKNVIATVQLARCHLRRGEREEGLKLLEDVFHDLTPSGSDEKDVWFFAAKQLGKLYLDELNRADLAIPCFQKYQESLNSGAETVYDLGRAYEAIGDQARALNHYKTVTGYEENPLRWDAEEAIRRLKGQV